MAQIKIILPIQPHLGGILINKIHLMDFNYAVGSFGDNKI